MKAAAVLGAILFATQAAAGVELTVTRETPTQVRLDWTGGLPPFSVYRAGVPGGLVSPGSLVATVSGSTWTDGAATGTLLFYDVEGPSCTGAGQCTVRDCAGQVMACGDCLDNDGDCRVDAADEHCLGACDNTENSFHPGLPIPSTCTQDCFFDGNGGTGDDDCTWSHRCDPLEVPPDYPPGGSACSHNPATTVGGRTCTQMMSSQSVTCLESCSGLTPNGCDFFGCCSIPGAPGPVWLGSVDAVGTPTCTLADLNDPARCKPCTPVISGTNTCAHCELCVGKTTLPGDCPVQLCPAGVAACGLPGQEPCPADSYCVTGCCQALPL